MDSKRKTDISRMSDLLQGAACAAAVIWLAIILLSGRSIASACAAGAFVILGTISALLCWRAADGDSTENEEEQECTEVLLRMVHKTRCPDCGRVLSERDAFCPACGRKKRN